MRVAVMHSLAWELYAKTEGTDFRDRITNRGPLFPFDIGAFNTIQNESRIVGMVMAWSVVTLESLVNHQLAAVLNNRILAVMAIEYPAQVTSKLNLNHSGKSELAKKLIILLDNTEPTTMKVVETADALADKRNTIVHDKPFRLIDHGDGEFETEWFRSRGNGDYPTFRYTDLKAFYLDCDLVARSIQKVSSEPLDCEIAFEKLWTVGDVE
jgi:hypothetical protein